MITPVRQGDAHPDGREGRGGMRAGPAAILIDFASTGVGLGMADVAMHLVHALVPSDLDGGGEEALIDGYLAALAAARGVAAVELSPYPRELALRHFRLATCDYGRFIMGRFWAAATPERFAAAGLDALVCPGLGGEPERRPRQPRPRVGAALCRAHQHVPR